MLDKHTRFAFKFIVLGLSLTVIIFYFIIMPLLMNESVNSRSWRTFLGSYMTHGNESSAKPRLILSWTTRYQHNFTFKSLKSLECKVSNCITTTDRSLLNQSDAILMHLYNVRLNDLPPSRFPSQRWVMVHFEPPQYTPRVLQRLNNAFNWTISYKTDSTIVMNPKVLPRSHPGKEVFQVAHKKTKMAAWVASNCKTAGKREIFVKELTKKIPVDVYGYCGQHRCWPRKSMSCVHDIAQSYRYYLSFENALCKDYVTEKLFMPLAEDIIPVVFGSAEYAKVAPPNSYIDALSFKSPAELGDFLLELAQDEQRYNSYFDWRNNYYLDMEPFICKLCEKLHENNPPSHKENIQDWFFGQAKCKHWTLVSNQSVLELN